MIATLQPYPEYRTAEGGWLGSIPVHWRVRRMKYILREQDSRSPEGQEQLLRVSQYTGVTKRLREDGLDEPDTRAESLVGYKRVEPNDLVINIMLAWNGSLGVSQFDGIASPAYCVYRFGAEAHPWYFHHLLRSPTYKSRIKAVSTGVVESRLRLYTDDLYRIEALVPPPKEQDTIVHFLDWANGRIERAMRAKKKLIGLLNEQKEAIIHRAVTRGLDPSIPLKASGIPWLEEIPQHWEKRKLKHVSRLKSGEGITALRIEATGPYPVFGGGGHRGYTSSYTHEGDFVLIGRQGALCGNIKYAHGKFFATEHAVVVTPITDYNIFWFGELLRTMNLNQYSQSAAQPGLSVERIQNLWIPFPPPGEQDQIVSYFRKKTGKQEVVIARLEREIALLQEYRARLVADVVTGKLDVREAAKNLPAEAQEPHEKSEPEMQIEEEVALTDEE